MENDTVFAWCKERWYRWRLASRDCEARRSAARRLAEVRSPSALATLLRASRDDESSVRAAVMVALIGFPEGVAVQRLIEGLTDQAPDVRASAEQAFAAIAGASCVAGVQSEAVVVAFLEAIGHERAEVRLHVVRHCIDLAGHARASAVLLRAAIDSDASVRREAMPELARIGGQLETDVVFGALRDGDADVRQAAEQALLVLEPRAFAGALTRALTHEDESASTAAMHWCANVAGRGALDALLHAAADSSPVARRRALDAIALLSDERAVGPVMRALGDANASVRDAGWRALEGFAPERLAQAFLRAFSDLHPLLRRAAVRWCERIPEQALPHWIAALADRDVGVRRGVVEALGRWRHARVVEPLVRALLDVDDGVQVRAEELLRSFPRDQLAAPLLRLLRGEREPTSRAIHLAAEVARVASQAPLVEALVELLEHSRPSVRRASVEALGRVGAVRSIPALFRELGDVDFETGRAARQSLADFPKADLTEAVSHALRNRASWRMNALRAAGSFLGLSATPLLLEALKRDGDDDARCAAFDALSERTPEVQSALARALGAVHPVPSDLDLARLNHQALARHEATPGASGSLADDPVAWRRSIESADRRIPTCVQLAAAQAFQRIFEQAALPPAVQSAVGNALAWKKAIKQTEDLRRAALVNETRVRREVQSSFPQIRRGSSDSASLSSWR